MQSLSNNTLIVCIGLQFFAFWFISSPIAGAVNNSCLSPPGVTFNIDIRSGVTDLQSLSLDHRTSVYRQAAVGTYSLPTGLD